MSLETPVVRKSLFFSFDDYRNPKNGKGHLVEQTTKNVYNHVSNWTDGEQRLNFTKLFFAQGITAAIIRIPFRVIDFLSAGSIRRGVAHAKHEYRILNVEKNGKISKLAYPLLVAKNVLACLAKDILKIVSYPLAMIALQFASILGMASPLDGWVVYAKIEDIWSFDNSLQTYKAAGCCQDLMMIYSAPCMQTQQSYKKHNLYPLLGNYKEDSLRSLKYRVSHELEHNSAYFGPAYSQLQSLIEKVNERINKILKSTKKYTTIQETDEDAKKILDLCDSLNVVVAQIEKILDVKDKWLHKITQPKSIMEPDPTPKQVKQLQTYLSILARQ